MLDEDERPDLPRLLVIDLDAGLRQLGEIRSAADFAAYVPEPGDAIVRVPCLAGAAA